MGGSMSNISLKGGPTGTGTVSIQAPSTSTDRTATLPDANITVAGTNIPQTFTATQVPDNGTAAISTTSTYTFDGADQIRDITLTNAITVTFGAPTGITQYAMYQLMLKAGDTSARTFAWNAAYKFPSAIPTITTGSTTTNAYDILTFVGGASNTLLFVGSQTNVS